MIGVPLLGLENCFPLPITFDRKNSICISLACHVVGPAANSYSKGHSIDRTNLSYTYINYKLA